MPTRLAPARLDQAVRALESAWGQGEPNLERHWAPHDADGSVAVLAALVKADLRCRYARGQRPSAADYLERFPALRAEKERVLSLIYEEFCLREERGEHLDADEFCAGYPSWRDSLASQLRYHELLSRVIAPRTPAPRFPEPGARFQEFRLESLLGRGGAAWVYRARDESLGGREVALKVSPDQGHEPSIMGRLDHAHIVPVLSVAFDSATGLRGICMPYRPGLPLDEVIRRVDPHSHPARAVALWEVLAPPEPAAGHPPWESFPQRGTYADGAAWVVLVLARALAHAHAEGILHRDVKPANVLLTLRDGPQLLDFNLAFDPHSADQAEAALRGGTLPYMAPEQLEAFLDPKRWSDVGAGADLYSLGLVLRELLTGQAPGTPDPKLPLPRAIRALLDRRADDRPSNLAHDPAIPHALESIAARCLAYAPADRYADAGALADDLERFLARGPLLYALNPSRRERITNRVRRHRQALGVGVLLVCFVTAALPNLVRRWTPIERRADFLAAVAEVDQGHSERALPALLRFLDAAPDSPLAQFYCGYALDQTGDTAGAAALTTSALADQRAEEVFSDWSRRHPGLSGQWCRLGLDLYAKQHYDLAQEALDEALRLDLTSEQARLGVATCREFHQKFAAALALLDPLIGEAEGRDTPEDRAKLGRWYPMRARDLIHDGEDQWRVDPARASVKAHNSFAAALDDLGRAERLLQPDDQEGRAHVHFVRAEALIALGELELRLEKFTPAQDAYKQAAAVFQEIDSTATTTDQHRKSLAVKLRLLHDQIASRQSRGT